MPKQKEFIKIPLAGKGFIQVVVLRDKEVCDFTVSEDRIRDYEIRLMKDSDILIYRLFSEALSKLQYARPK